MAAPPEELCIGCHESKRQERALELDLWMHGPVAQGLCVACHSPHQSPRRYMLLKEDNEALCTQCHSGDGIRERTPEPHAEARADCVSCHNPHMGRTAMLVRAEFDEAEVP